MTKQLLSMTAAAVLTAFVVIPAPAQRSRASVPASEVNGTFRHTFSGKFKGSSSEIKILALGKGKLKIMFDLVYPFVDGTGELSANLGQAMGVATIEGDTAVYKPEDGEDCTITIKFVKPGRISVEQDGASSCGFGHNVTAAGNYVRASTAKPQFPREL